jgi:transcriptional regulator with XRE-family HTH domain
LGNKRSRIAIKNVKTMKQEHLKELGKRIKTIREELRMRQKEFAAELGISGSLISQIESGQKNPVYELLYKLMSKYRVSLDWLFSGKGEMFLKRKPEVEAVEDKYIDEIVSIDDLVWYLENSNLFNLNVMGYAARFFFENEEHIKKELERKRKKRKGK